MRTSQPTTPTGHTDFGREVHGEALSLTEALRKRTGQMARAEAFRYQLAMGLIGFFGGLVLVVPMVLWMTPRQPVDGDHGGSALLPGTFAEASNSGAQSLPSLLSAPTIADRAVPSADASTTLPPRQETVASSEAEQQIEMARGLIRSGDILGARRLLERSEARDSGQALFMLAETYDPNVLAALGATGVIADARVARRYYEAALAESVDAAIARLEALD